jgi:hypothetical protein
LIAMSFPFWTWCSGQVRPRCCNGMATALQ